MKQLTVYLLDRNAIAPKINLWLPEKPKHILDVVEEVRTLVKNLKPDMTTTAATYSHTVLRTLQTEAALGHISKEDIDLVFINDKGDLYIADLHEDGTYGDWACDYSDLTMDLQEKFINAVFDAQDRNNPTP